MATQESIDMLSLLNKTTAEGSATKAGVVKLSNSLSSLSSTGDGVAATPFVVRLLNSIKFDKTDDNQEIKGTGNTFNENVTFKKNISVFGLAYRNGWNMQYNSDSGELMFDGSSRRFKTNITNLEDDFSKILLCHPKIYDKIQPNGEPYQGKKEIGYIAEDLEELNLEHLLYRNKAGELMGIDYIKMAVVYFQPLIRQLFDRVNELESTVNMLKNNKN
jgi:hypothetical protein